MADEIVKIDDHASEARDRFLEQYKGKIKHTSVVDAISAQYQDMEDTLITFLAARAIPTAVGTQLDLIGTVVDQPRPLSTTDARYRVLLFIKIGQNTSKGDVKKIVNIYRLITEANIVFYQNLNRAAILLATDKDIDPLNDPEDVRFIYDNMQEVVAGGVRLDYLICYSPNDDAFAFEGNNANAPGLGFGSVTDVLAGGKFASIHRLIIPFAFDGPSERNLGFGSVLDPLVGGTFVST